MNKLMVFLLIFSVVFTFAACSPKENETTTADLSETVTTEQNETSTQDEETETEDLITK